MCGIRGQKPRYTLEGFRLHFRILLIAFSCGFKSSLSSTQPYFSHIADFLLQILMQHLNPSTHRQRNETSPPNQQAPAANPALVTNNASASSGRRVGGVASTASSGERGRDGSGTQLQPQPVREKEVQVDTISLQGVKVVLYPNPVGSHVHRIKSYAKALTSDVGGFGYMFPSSNYEDECPTCLEGAVQYISCLCQVLIMFP